VDTAECKQVGVDGPCTGVCHKWVSHTSVVDVTERVETSYIEEEQIAYIGENVIARYVPSNGFIGLYELLENHPSHYGKCPSLTRDPLFSAVVPFTRNVMSPLDDGSSLMFHNPSTGKYAVWTCDLSDVKSLSHGTGHSAPCGVTAEGVVNQTIGASSIVPMGNFSLVVTPATKKLSFLHRRELESEDGSFQMRSTIFEENVFFVADRPDLVNRKLFSIGHNNLFEFNRASGEYRVWLVDGSRGVLLGPAAIGFLPTGLSHSVAWMGDDRMLSWNNDDLSYHLMRFDMQQFPHQTPLGFTTIGRGNLEMGSCEYHSCADCTQDSHCGWCNSLNKCMPGNRLQPCAQQERCVTYTYGYCSAVPCNRMMTRGQCAAVGACGWCETSKSCVPQVGGKAVFGDCAVDLAWEQK